MKTDDLNPGLAFKERDIAVRTMAGEASDQGETGLAAVAWVIRNRAEWRPHAWWGASVIAVCGLPWQFSCWNQDDPNRERILALATTDEEYRAARAVFEKVMAGEIPDPTGGATHYKIRGTKTQWDSAVSGVEPRRIGRHDFWRLAPAGQCLAFIGHEPAPAAAKEA